jgi:hypothetical protein
MKCLSNRLSTTYRWDWAYVCTIRVWYPRTCNILTTKCAYETSDVTSFTLFITLFANMEELFNFDE